MKRISILAAVLFGLTVAAIGALYAQHPASAVSVNDGYKCYRATVQEASGREIKPIYISDQFEEKNLIIRAPLMYCAPANKSETLSSAAGEIVGAAPVVCYSIKDAPGQPRFRRTTIETADQFYDQLLQITKAYALCEPNKQSGVSTEGVDAQNVADYRFKCYTAHRTERISPGSLDLFISDKFGGKEATIGRPTVFCTEVFEKKGSAKNDRIDRAIEISNVPFEDHISTLTATHPRTDPQSSCGKYDHSVWYLYTPAEKATAYISTLESNYGTVIGVYAGNPDSLDEVDCEGPTGPPGLEVKLNSGTTYWILVGGVRGEGGGKLKFGFDVEAACASDCADPEPDAVAIRTPERPTVPVIESEVPLNLVCYTLNQRVREATVSVADQFRQQTLELGRATMYCTPARKCLILQPGGRAAIRPAGC